MHDPIDPHQTGVIWLQMKARLWGLVSAQRWSYCRYWRDCKRPGRPEHRLPYWGNGAPPFAMFRQLCRRASSTATDSDDGIMLFAAQLAHGYVRFLEVLSFTRALQLS